MEHTRGVGVHYRVFLHHLVGWQAHHGLVVLFLGRGQALFAAHDDDRLDHRFRRGVLGGAFLLVFLRHGVRIGMRIDAARHVDTVRVVHRPFAGRQPAVRHQEGGAAQVLDFLDLFAHVQAAGQVDQRTFGVTEDQQVGLGFGQHRLAHLVRPVVVVGDAAQRGFDRADDDRRAREGFAGLLGVHGHGAVGALVRLGVRGVGIVGTDLAVGRVAVDHRVHIAGGDAVIQARLAQRTERFHVVPVRLGDDAHAVALRFEQAADQRHAKAWVVDIGIAGHQNDVALVPAQGVHFGAGHGKERRSRSTRRPLGDGREKIGWGIHPGIVPEIIGFRPSPSTKNL